MKSKVVASFMALTMAVGSVAYAASQNYNSNYSINYSIANNEITVTNNVKNPDTVNKKDVLCIVAKYDGETNNLIEAHVEPLFIPNNLQSSVGVKYSYPVAAGQIIKMMIWDAKTIKPYSYDSKSLVAIREKETFDTAKIQYPEYQLSGGQYVYKPVAEDRNHANSINDRVTSIPGGIINPSSTFTYEGNSYHDGTSNFTWEVASIVDGALFVDGQGSMAAQNTYLPAKLRINFNKDITEDVTISARFKFANAPSNDVKLDFMSLYDVNGKRIIRIGAGANKLSFFTGKEIGSSSSLDKNWHEMSYSVNLMAGNYTVTFDGKKIGTYAFENQPTGSLDYLFFSNGSTSAVTANCMGYYLDYVGIDNGL